MIRVIAASFMAMVVIALAMGGEPMAWTPVEVPGCGIRVSAIAPSPHQPEVVLIGTATAGIYHSENGGERWGTAVGLNCPSINSIAWHPKISAVVWACTMNGVYVSRDSGKSWALQSMGMPTESIVEGCKYPAPVSKIIFDPRDPRHMVAFTGVPNSALASQAKVGGVWESRDGGSLWRKISIIGDTQTDKDADSKEKEAESSGVSIIDGAFPGRIPMLLVAVSNGGGYYESIDAGKTWRNKSKGLPHGHLAGLSTFPNRMDTLVVNVAKAMPELGETQTRPGGIYKTISGGVGWFSISNGLPNLTGAKEHHVTGYRAFCMASSMPSVMYACDGSFMSGIIFKSIDGGKAWTPLATQKHFGQEPSEAAKGLHQVETFFSVGLSHLRIMATDPKNPEVVYAGGDNLLIRSKDGGKTWTDLSARKTTAGTWVGTGLGLIDATCIGFDPGVDGRIVVTARGVAKILESLDGGKTWALHGDDVFPWGGGNAVAFSKRRAFVGTGQFGMFGSIVTALGTKWKTVADPSSKLPPIKRCGQVSDVIVDGMRANVVYAVIGGSVYTSTDFGRTWRKTFNRRDLEHLAGVPKKPNTFYVSGARTCYVHSGLGKFRPIGGPQEARKMVCDPQGRLLLASSGVARPGLWQYDGKVWKRLLDQSYVVAVAIDPKHPNRLAVCTNDRDENPSIAATGVWLSDDGGEHWTNVNDGLPFTPGEAVTFNPKDTSELWFATSGGGVYAMTWPLEHKLAGDHLYASTEEDRKYCVYRATNRITTVAGKGGVVPNPLRNGDMEQGTTQATFWSSRWTGRGRVLIARDTANAYQGEASLRIQSVGGSAKGQIAQVMLAGNVKQVTVVAYVKTAGKTGAQLAVQAFDPKWKTLKYHTIKHFRKANKWMRIEGTVVLPPGTARFGLGLLIDGEGTAWVDDVRMTVK